jgi:glycerate-2-kinase
VENVNQITVKVYTGMSRWSRKSEGGFSIIFNMGNTSQKKMLKELFQAALKAVDPYEAVKRYTDRITSVYRTCCSDKIHVIGFGKASCRMVRALEDSIGDLIEDAIVITKYGHCESLYKSKKINIFEAGHPVPDKNGLRGTEEVMSLLKNSPEKRLIVSLISGGGSALLVSPYEGITLNEKQVLTDVLLKAGVDIYGLNTVRKHISRVKGGRLAEIAYPAHMVSLILSDVIGDRLDVIASGPTSPDTTTYNDALQVLEEYRIRDKVPPAVVDLLEKGKKGVIPETPKEESKIFKRLENIIIGSNKIALIAAQEEAEKRGLTVEIISSELSGEAKEMGKWLAGKAQEIKQSKDIRRPHCLISGGETTVTVTGIGLGGRNMELGLSFAMETEGMNGITLLSAGTDGTDGPTDAAGAIVDGQTVIRAKALGMVPETYVKNNDSYHFFKEINELFVTGPTGTNVMDIQIMVLT